jgi:hypothetical protein
MIAFGDRSREGCGASRGPTSNAGLSDEALELVDQVNAALLALRKLNARDEVR